MLTRLRAPRLAAALVTGLAGVASLASLAAAQDVSAGFGESLFAREAQILPTPHPGNRTTTADWNEDGRDDLVVPDTSGAGFVLFLGQPGGGVTPAATIPMWPTTLKWGDLFAGDVDGDGHLDVLAHPGPSNDMSFIRGHGDGSFDPFVTSDLWKNADDIAVGDVDGDGLPDVVAASLSLHWMQGLGDGTFGPGQTVSNSLAIPQQLSLDDVDGDGRLDILVIEFDSGTSTNVVRVRRGLGSGSFAAPTAWSSDADLAVVSGDVDGDGVLDLVHGTHADIVRVLRGLGGATFADPVDLDLGPGIVDLAAADLDRDGFADVIGSRWTDPVAALVAQRMGPAGPVGPPHVEPLALPGLQPGLSTADFDADGLLDVVASPYVAVVGNTLGPFIALGHALPSPQGTPTLQLSGTPVPDQLVTVQASGPSATGWLLFGLQPSNVPLAGGLLVPDVTLVVPIGPAVSFTARWPTAFAVGTTLYAQAWYAVPGGAAASDAWVAIGE